jgi:hypothetical protein
MIKKAQGGGGGKHLVVNLNHSGNKKKPLWKLISRVVQSGKAKIALTVRTVRLYSKLAKKLFW